MIRNLSENICENNEELQDISCEEQHKELKSELQEQRQLILQSQNDYNVLIEQQQLKEQELREQRQEVILQQHSEQILQQLLKKQTEEIEQLKDRIATHLQQSPKSYARSNLEEISRKNLLTPRAKKLYEKTVQLKKEKRRLKRRINQVKQSSSKVMKFRRQKKGRNDKTADVRQQIVRMIVRNNDVAPQV